MTRRSVLYLRVSTSFTVQDEVRAKVTPLNADPSTLRDLLLLYIFGYIHTLDLDFPLKTVVLYNALNTLQASIDIPTY